MADGDKIVPFPGQREDRTPQDIVLECRDDPAILLAVAARALSTVAEHFRTRLSVNIPDMLFAFRIVRLAMDAVLARCDTVLDATIAELEGRSSDSGSPDEPGVGA